MGEKDAEIYFEYHRPSGRYIPIDEEGNEIRGDHRDDDWLEKIEQVKKELNKDNN